MLQTKPREELRAKLNLERQGYETYVPIDSKGVLFPGYAFVQIDDADPRPIASTRGVLCLVRFGERLATVPDQLIEGFKSTEWLRAENYAPNTKVRIKEGFFKFHEAIIQERRGDRIVLLLNFMNRPQTVLMNTRQVEAA